MSTLFFASDDHNGWRVERREWERQYGAAYSFPVLDELPPRQAGSATIGGTIGGKVHPVFGMVELLGVAPPVCSSALCRSSSRAPSSRVT